MSKARILHFGLPSHPTDPTISNYHVQQLVQSGANKARQAGYEVQLTFLNPEDFEGSINELRSMLATGDWDALIIGGGVKNTPKYTPEFEKTVNASREVAPGMRILFQMRPDDIWETVRRGFEGV